MLNRLKKFEALARRLRYLTSPQSHHCVRDLIGSSASLSEGQRAIALDFRSPEIDSVGGRYLYYLVKDIIAAGYYPLFRSHYFFLASFPHKKYKRLILDLSFGIYRYRDELSPESVLITDRKSKENWSRIVTIDYEHRLPVPCELALPFSCHPDHLKTNFSFADLRSPPPRQRRILFAGRAERPDYDRAILSDKYGVLSRAKALDRIKARQEEFPKQALELRDQTHHRVPASEWLPLLASAEFFLCLPGVHMPMCHNLIECLALGTIPILQYPQYLDPPLEDGVNCLTFSTGDELVAVLHRALALPHDERNRISQECIDYYEKNLALGTFSKRLFSPESEVRTILPNSYRVPRPLTS